MRDRSRWTTTGLLLAHLCAASAMLRAQAPLEYPVKAAFVLNFARFVEWPDSAFATPSSPLTICVLGADPFGGILDVTVGGERVHNRPVVVQRAPRATQLPPQTSCHLAFVAGTSPGDTAEALAAFQ